MNLILASRSPRRKEILSMLGVPFTVVSADVDEQSELSDPTLLVRELALRKGRATRDLLRVRGELRGNTLILAADTVVAVDGRILGKPSDESEAKQMLRLLSGRTHRVISGIALVSENGECVASEETAVRFSVLSETDIDRYVQSGEPMDKAGAYAVQGLASVFIDGIDGDYFSVVGLPVHRFDELLRQFVGAGIFALRKAENTKKQIAQ